MKKLMLSLALILVLICWGWQGYQGVGTAPALGQPPPPYYSCDPYYYQCDYYNYYNAPYTDPGTQFFYYTLPWAGEELEEHLERRERPRREYREHRREEHPRRY